MRSTARALAFGIAGLIVTLLFPAEVRADPTFKTLHTFTYGADGAEPQGSCPVFDAAGNLYATTYWGGWWGWGSVFMLSPQPDGTWTQTVLYDFCGEDDGGMLRAGVIIDAAGNLYGTAVYHGAMDAGVVFRLARNPDHTWTYTILHAFSGLDGSDPGFLTLDPAGNLYGTTAGGGEFGHGVLFRLSPNSDGTWTNSVLHNFTGGKDGSTSWSELILDSEGSLYGTTSLGGQYGFGNVFKATPDSDDRWTLRVLHQFAGEKDGAIPYAGLVADKRGRLYGTTTSGGGHGYGSVFRLAPLPSGRWRSTILHGFTGGKDGANPWGGLAMDASGGIYGTTRWGGLMELECHEGQGCGVIFKLTRLGSDEWKGSTLHRFTMGPDGSQPLATPMVDAEGRIYGTTNYGGRSDAGVVYELTP